MKGKISYTTKSKMLTMFLKAAINIASAKQRKLYIAGGNLLYFIACKVQFTVNIAKYRPTERNQMPWGKREGEVVNY